MLLLYDPPPVHNTEQRETIERAHERLEELAGSLQTLLKSNSSLRLEAKQWLLNAIGDLDGAALARPDRLDLFLPGERFHDPETHSHFTTAALLLLIEIAPRQVGHLLADQSQELTAFFLDHAPSVARAWFATFSPAGLSTSGPGARSLARYALAHRERVWSLLAWTGKHPQAPVAVAQKPHYWCELDAAASARAILRRDSGFLSDPDVKQSLAEGEFLALDPKYFAQTLQGWLDKPSLRGDRLRRVMRDVLAEESRWRARCQRLLPTLPDRDLLLLANRILDPQAQHATPAGDEAGLGLVFQCVDWRNLDDLILASALGASPRRLLAAVRDTFASGSPHAQARTSAVVHRALEAAQHETPAGLFSLRNRAGRSPADLASFFLLFLCAARAAVQGAADLAPLLRNSGLDVEVVTRREASQRSGSKRRRRSRGEEESGPGAGAWRLAWPDGSTLHSRVDRAGEEVLNHASMLLVEALRRCDAEAAAGDAGTRP